MRKPVFDAIKLLRGGKSFDNMEVGAIDNLLDALGVPVGQTASTWKQSQISERIQLEILEHEGILTQAYKDSVGVWTWGAGVTDASGHNVARYKDNPSTMKKVLEVFEWLLRTKYLPEVLEAFKGYTLTENQLGAALSFHWNTGAIRRATWVSLVLKGDMSQAKRSIMDWSKPKEIIPRRQLERDLFFDGKWSSDGIVTVYTRVHPRTYAPDWSSSTQVDVRGLLREVVAFNLNNA